MTLQELKEDVLKDVNIDNNHKNILMIYLDMAFVLGERNQIEKQLKELSTKSFDSGLTWGGIRPV